MLTLSGIYEYILNYFPYYQTDDSPWRNHIRHELSIQKKVFKKLPEKVKSQYKFTIDFTENLYIKKKIFKKLSISGLQRPSFLDVAAFGR